MRTRRALSSLAVTLVAFANAALVWLPVEAAPDVVAGETDLHVNVDWASFLARHDLVWKAAPTGPFTGPFVGNGVLGAMLYQQEGSLRLDVGRTDVAEHAPNDGRYSDLGRIGRMPVGHFELTPPIAVSGWDARLDLYRAEFAARVRTAEGDGALWLFAHATEPVIVFEWKIPEKHGAAKLEWMPGDARVARAARNSPHRNPAPEITTRNEVNVCIQPRVFGGDYATAWREMALEHGTHRLFVSIIDRFPETGSADGAVAAVERAVAMDFDKFVRSHRQWWKDYYPASFLSVPFAEMESFYWVQIYKLGSAIRKNGPLCDLMGPWYVESRWPAAWWNMNTQVLYSPFPVANRLGMAENLSDSLHQNMPNLIANVPKEWQHDSAGISRATGQDLSNKYDSSGEKANLIWACHNLWVQYRCTMDERFLKERLYPLLRRAVSAYLHQIEKDDQGVYHVPHGHSPESYSGRDTNYDLSSLRWGCRTLLRITDQLHVKDEKAEQWADVLENLAEYPRNEDGLMNAPGAPAPVGHRHWSHLMMIYPYCEITWDQPENRDLIRRSFDHWTSGRRNVHAWSQAYQSSVCSFMGDGEGALRHMKRSLNSFQISPNTMHQPGGNPCSETYGATCRMLQDMLIQSWGDKIRVFPGVPQKWEDAVFHNLRAEGAFLVSAVRKEGKTAWVHVHSLAGEPCVLQVNFGGKTPKVLANREMKLTNVNPGVWSLDIDKGESAVLYAGDDAPRLEIAPLAMASPSYAVMELDYPWNKDLRSFSGHLFHYIGITSSMRRSQRGRVAPRRWRRVFWASSGSVTQRSRMVPLWWPCRVWVGRTTLVIRNAHSASVNWM